MTVYFDSNKKVEITRRQLPHWRQEGVCYFVTFRLADSVPQSKLRLWKEQKEAFLRAHPKPLHSRDKKEYQERFTDKIQQWLDRGIGSCTLKDPEVSCIMAQCLTHFDKARYDLDEWVVMPNHVHVILIPREEYELSKILHAWKSFSAKAINEYLKRKGPFWQNESFNQIIRNEQHLFRAREYIKRNPEKAGVKVNHASWIRKQDETNAKHRLEARAT